MLVVIRDFVGENFLRAEVKDLRIYCLEKDHAMCLKADNFILEFVFKDKDEKDAFFSFFFNGEIKEKLEIEIDDIERELSVNLSIEKGSCRWLLLKKYQLRCV